MAGKIRMGTYLWVWRSGQGSSCAEGVANMFRKQFQGPASITSLVLLFFLLTADRKEIAGSEQFKGRKLLSTNTKAKRL